MVLSTIVGEADCLPDVAGFRYVTESRQEMLAS